MKLLIAVLLLVVAWPVWADNHLIETRYCGEPERYSNGAIKRSKTVTRAFERLYPLPDEYNREDWQIDHVIPLAEGCCDAVRNLQWLPKTIKTCPGEDCKDRWERGGIYRRR